MSLHHPPLDRLARPIRDLRISLIDRCNLRCTYCMPSEVFGPDYAFLPQRELLSFDEIVLLIEAFAACGVSKIRLTGGEPLLRPGVAELIQRIKGIGGIEDVALTTNAIALPRHILALKAAGLDRVNVSLDAIDPEIFRRMSGGRGDVKRGLDGIDAAANEGLPVKINMVVERGVNEHEILPMAQTFRERGHTLRFIEFMDVGNHNDWNQERVYRAADILKDLRRSFELIPIDAAYMGEVAKRYRYSDGAGEVGFITSISKPFCGDCSRARISAEGKLFTCLFASIGYDFRKWLRDGEDPEALTQRIVKIWSAREDRYSELRSERVSDRSKKVEMSYIGG